MRYRLCSTVNAKKSQEIETPSDLAHHNCLHYGLREFGNEWRFQRDEEEAPISSLNACAIRRAAT